MSDSDNKIDSGINSANESKINAGIKDSDIGREFTLEDLHNASNFDLPPVTEKTDGFIDEKTNQYTEQQTAQESAPPNPAEKYRGQLSSKGDKYSPGVHEYPPRENKSGMWAKIRGKKGQPKPQEHVQAEQTGVNMRAYSENLALLYGDGHKVIYGMQGGRVVSEEVSQLANALERYMIEKGAIETSAGLSVLINTIAYTRGVAARPENKTVNQKIIAFGARIFAPVIRWFKKPEKQPPQPAQVQEQPSDNLYHGEG